MPGLIIVLSESASSTVMHFAYRIRSLVIKFLLLLLNCVGISRSHEDDLCNSQVLSDEINEINEINSSFFQNQALELLLDARHVPC